MGGYLIFKQKKQQTLLFPLPIYPFFFRIQFFLTSFWGSLPNESIRIIQLPSLTLQNMLSPLEGCTSIRMLQSSTWKVPLNLSCLFYFSLYVRINKQVPSAFNVSVVSTLGGNTPQYVPAMESKSTLFSKTAVYSSTLTGSISASFCFVSHKI